MAQTKPGEKQNTILWWVGWITLTIVTFFISCYFWTDFISKHVGNMTQKGVPVLWVAAVFGSWMLLLVPLIILMYNKVDRAYEDARINREAQDLKKTQKILGLRNLWVPEEQRTLPKNLTEKLKKVPQTIKRGHLVTLALKNGKRIENVFVLDRQEIAGIYDASAYSFKIEDVTDLEPADLDHLPAFEARKWLRLDIPGEPGTA